MLIKAKKLKAQGHKIVLAVFFLAFFSPAIIAQTQNSYLEQYQSTLHKAQENAAQNNQAQIQQHGAQPTQVVTPYGAEPGEGPQSITSFSPVPNNQGSHTESATMAVTPQPRGSLKQNPWVKPNNWTEAAKVNPWVKPPPPGVVKQSVTPLQNMYAPGSPPLPEAPLPVPNSYSTTNPAVVVTVPPQNNNLLQTPNIYLPPGTTVPPPSGAPPNPYAP